MHKASTLPVGHVLRTGQERRAEFERIAKALQALKYNVATVYDKDDAMSEMYIDGHGVRMRIRCDGTTLPDLVWQCTVPGMRFKRFECATFVREDGRMVSLRGDTWASLRDALYQTASTLAVGEGLYGVKTVK